MFVVELVEVNAHPRQAGSFEFEDFGGDTVGLFLCMMKSYFSTGRYVIIDYGFYVLKGLIQLRRKGFLSCNVINNRRYWPSMVPGKYMEDHFREMEVGEIDAIQKKVYDVIYNLWGMKDPAFLFNSKSSILKLLCTLARLCEETPLQPLRPNFFGINLPFD